MELNHAEDAAVLAFTYLMGDGLAQTSISTLYLTIFFSFLWSFRRHLSCPRPILERRVRCIGAHRQAMGRCTDG